MTQSSGKQLQFCYNRYTRMRSGKEYRASIPSPCGGHVTLQHQCIRQPGSSTDLQCPEFLLGLHYVDRHHWPEHWTRFPAFPPLPGGLWLKVPIPKLSWGTTYSHLISITKEIPRIFQTSVREPGQKPNKLFVTLVIKVTRKQSKWNSEQALIVKLNINKIHFGIRKLSLS